jgi:copper homeostasis protein (lipoprotein)
VALLLPGCHSTPPIPAADRALPVLVGVFTGTVPCADCSGIRTDITLVTSNPDRSSDGTFSLVEHYLGTRTGDRAFRRHGRWSIVKGTKGVPDAIVYQLTADDGGRTVRLRRVDADTVRVLAEDGTDRAPGAGYTLRRPAPSLLGGYREVDASMPDVRAAADHAVTEHGSRTGTSVTLRQVLWAARQVVAGVRFRMCIEATAAGARSIATVVVFRTLEQQLSLSEWIEGCEPVPPP